MSPLAKPAPAHIALLRGINVGGKNLLPMKELAALFTAAGALEAQTYIQSGNVVFRARPALAAKLSQSIAKAIEKKFALKVPVLIRSAKALQAIAENNPYLNSGAELTHLHVSFLAGTPEDAHVSALDKNRSAPDEFTVQGSEIYLRLPDGAGNSKLTNAWFDSKLKTISTMRNWNTVLKLIELSGAGKP